MIGLRLTSLVVCLLLRRSHSVLGCSPCAMTENQILSVQLFGGFRIASADGVLRIDQPAPATAAGLPAAPPPPPTPPPADRLHPLARHQRGAGAQEPAHLADAPAPDPARAGPLSGSGPVCAALAPGCTVQPGCGRLRGGMCRCRGGSAAWRDGCGHRGVWARRAVVHGRPDAGLVRRMDRARTRAAAPDCTWMRWSSWRACWSTRGACATRWAMPSSCCAPTRCTRQAIAS